MSPFLQSLNHNEIVQTWYIINRSWTITELPLDRGVYSSSTVGIEEERVLDGVSTAGEEYDKYGAGEQD